MSLTDPLLPLLPRVHALQGWELRNAVEQFDDPSRPPSGVGPLYDESLYAMWCAEGRMPHSLRRLYYRELCGPAARFDASNGSCLGSDAYEWTLIHPEAKDRARAFVRTHIIARLAELYDDGQLVDHPILLGLQDEFVVVAAELGRAHEPDFDHEAWIEQNFEELFAPLREGYRP